MIGEQKMDYKTKWEILKNLLDDLTKDRNTENTLVYIEVATLNSVKKMMENIDKDDTE